MWRNRSRFELWRNSSNPIVTSFDRRQTQALSKEGNLVSERVDHEACNVLGPKGVWKVFMILANGLLLPSYPKANKICKPTTWFLCAVYVKYGSKRRVNLSFPPPRESTVYSCHVLLGGVDEVMVSRALIPHHRVVRDEGEDKQFNQPTYFVFL